jgi:hypothetical protein
MTRHSSREMDSHEKEVWRSPLSDLKRLLPKTKPVWKSAKY